MCELWIAAFLVIVHCLVVGLILLFMHLGSPIIGLNIGYVIMKSLFLQHEDILSQSGEVYNSMY